MSHDHVAHTVSADWLGDGIALRAVEEDVHTLERAQEDVETFVGGTVRTVEIAGPNSVLDANVDDVIDSGADAARLFVPDRIWWQHEARDDP